ncbi:hypothetical protein Q3G72_029240 [Acer saccharum]|nr:hypothetical protein Q3G72_029240 [Acer saccharum]
MGSIEALSSAPKPKPVIKVVALCGSLRKASNNLGLIRAAMELMKEEEVEMEIEYIEISTLPMLNTDLLIGYGVFPPVVEDFRRKILEADCFLFASPEYNYSVTASLKNALDWASCPPTNVWADKAAAIVSASGSLGGARGQYHLRQIGVYLDLHIINKPELFLNGFDEPAKFDSNGDLIDPEAKLKLKQLLLALHAFTLRLRNNS